MKHTTVMEKDPRAQLAMDRWSELRRDRIPYENAWRDIAKLIRPQRRGIGLDDPAAEDRDPPLSSAPIQAHGNFAAGIYASITNPASDWGGLTTPDQDLNRWPPFAEWLDRHTRKVRNTFSPARSGFYSASYQAYADISAFGAAAAYDEIELSTRRFVDVTVNIGEVVVSIDFHGRVVEVVRKMRLTPLQAARYFGKDNLPAKVVELLDKGTADRHVYYHHVLRNEDFEPRRLGPKGKRWLSRYVCEVGVCLLRERGYHEMPFYYPRWDVDTGESHGMGPGFIALASTRVNHQMDAATLRASQFAADPLRLVPDRNAVPLDGQWRPGGTIYGGMVNGREQVATTDFTGNIGLTIEEKRAKIEEIKDAFYYSVMSLTGRTGISDDENRVIEEARLRNWAPHADRIMEEYAARKFERRYQMLFRAGQIEPLPEGMPKGAVLQIQYTSAAAMALAASKANAVRRYFMDLSPVMQLKPELRHRFSADDYAEILHEASPSLPQRLLVSREEAAAAAEAEAQQQQMAQMAELAKTGGAGLRDMAQGAAALQGGGQEGGIA